MKGTIHFTICLLISSTPPTNFLEIHHVRQLRRLERDALRDDIIRNGVLQPAIVRCHPTMESRYQIIAGHNRRTGARDAGYKTLPCIIRQLDDDLAQLQLISSNLKQRLELFPSEKAFAYKLQLEAMKRQGFRTDLSLSQAATKIDTAATLGEQSGESRDQVFRYIRLTKPLKYRCT